MAETRHPGGSAGSPSPGHERSDLAPRSIGIFLLVLAVMIAGVLAASVWIYNYSADRLAGTGAPPSPLAKPEAPPGPRLQVSAPKDMQALRAAEDEILKTYGWVDRAKGVVRIPIDRATQLLVERGLPAAGAKGEAAKGKRK